MAQVVTMPTAANERAYGAECRRQIADNLFNSKAARVRQATTVAVDLGDGLFMMAAQFNHCVKKSATDSKMVRNTALSLWTHEELLVRSVTGNPSRRFLKECPEGTKQPMTPKKLKIVRAALRAYIGNRPKEEVDARLAKTNTYLATYVQDTCTRWKRAQLKKGQEAAAEAEEMELLSILSPLHKASYDEARRKLDKCQYTFDLASEDEPP
ncbi:hypothetical protein HPB47_015483 [Ixodes persulcatus]|uniref:Uncharacterized protein n=1 Tax=Ixodes persulcatus TaxID=34615 RepID=A0AC60QTI9_IXOPE|nr:hypothetical protein HPB47_015483 [Ixodes persulcatus]